MFDALFGKKPAPPNAHKGPVVSFDAVGIRYSSPAPSTREWLDQPFAFTETADLGARLAQIHVEGFGDLYETDFLLPWRHVYALLRHPELSAYREALLIPPVTVARPRLVSKGALMDLDFTVLLDEWVDGQGRSLQPVPRLVGRVLQSPSGAALVSEPLHQLLEELSRFHATPPPERSQSFKEQAFGRIRKLATSTGCPVSDYVARTIVLTPDQLRLTMERRGDEDAKVLEVIPGFDRAPEHWLHHFDRLPLQDSYDVPDGPSLIRVVVAPEVKAVLAEIKRMPGRRATGPRAEAFVRNPFAVLGESAEQVIDPEQFEKAREEAGIRFEQFTPHVERGEFGEVYRVGLLVEELGNESKAAEVLWFTGPDDLQRFTGKLGRAFTDGSQCVAWQRRDLEIVGDTERHLIDLEQWGREWACPQLWTAAEVLNLSNYSDRVEDIGVEKPFVTPVIARNDQGSGWFEGNVSVGLRVEDSPAGSATYVPLTFRDVPTLQQAVKAAELAGQSSVKLPGLRNVVPIVDARRAVDALAKAQQQLREDSFKPPGDRPPAEPKKRLVIKRNLEDVDYTEARAESLQMPQDREPLLPQTLRPEIELKPHQRIGVAWLQHLWEASPDHCRGTVLADDMGLGKTLQLLTFIISCFETDPTLPPALVVAPVALLENWRNELDRFFQRGTLPLLMLYGSTLKSMRVGKHELDADLRAQGVTRLLKKGWVGDARLVLTTYETMRDLEFALASLPWSIMVCDEAQKIKTPAALVTRSAKKQKVRFRIACTGTPVENTLADLWCLFDFVQPGMLGALCHFSRTYRQPIEAKTPEQIAKVEELRAVIQPQILHRRKTEVARDLPTPVEDKLCKQLPMSPFQQGLYESALKTLREQRVINPSAQLQALQAIRKICSDPHGYATRDSHKAPIDKIVNESPKMGWLVGRLKALAVDDAGNHKVIIFCEFRELQLQLQRVIAAFFGIAASIVNGDTSADPRAAGNRQQLIDAFQQARGFNVIILSPLAVGFGVNIQAANHVVHFTRTWNPAKEDQATARAYRIGQTRTVNVYYPGVVSDQFPSFDVKLDALLSSKRALATDILNGCSDLKASDFADFG
ncbi:DEAD/DEAH box helicase [Curvibacter sp. HBC61]|uniref:DEAD/DEAH box helicase n=1 Tax=Curvibacter cyanobacteriorum TaxID=3026422 RepID=A0ABT5MXI4_9BURK|nr:DEAD/DEAH box helicase [Curvibacter sp. HBC61]MDD0838756.1 DEAD/DEAH box helicase [Curvibacter sp. HBC61]